jgi:hypothetical protein
MTPDWFELALVALMTWRLAVLFVLDDGPFGVIEAVRAWATREGGFEETDAEGVFLGPRPLLGGALQCVGCFSLWMAPVALLVAREAPEEVVLVLSSWAAATLAHRAVS